MTTHTTPDTVSDIDTEIDVVQSQSGKASRRFSRITGLSGLAFIASVPVSMALVGEMPVASDDAQTIRTYLAENTDRHNAGLLVIGFAVVPALLFLAGLVRAHRTADRRSGEGWGTAIAGFWIFAIAFMSIGVMIDGALMLSRDVGLSDSALLAFWDLSAASGAMMMLGFAATAASVGVSVLTSGIRPAWYGWLSLLSGVLGVLGLGTLVSDSDGIVNLSMPMFPVFIVWVVATSVFVYREA